MSVSRYSFPVVMVAGQSIYMHDGPACKAKWNQFIGNHNLFADLYVYMEGNTVCYRVLLIVKHITNGLPRLFLNICITKFISGMVLHLRSNPLIFMNFLQPVVTLLMPTFGSPHCIT
jgi:hypothetical protein